MSAAAILSLINYGFVLIFGIIVSFYFAGIVTAIVVISEII